MIISTDHSTYMPDDEAYESYDSTDSDALGTVLDAPSTASMAYNMADDPTEHELRAITVRADQHRARLDRVLADGVPEFSRNYLSQLVEAGVVTVEGKSVIKPAAKVSVGDVVQVTLQPTAQSLAFRPEEIAIEIIHRDADLLVIHKPAGLVVHPAAGNWSGTLLNALLHHDPACAQLPRAGIVHRLDKDTSGLMVVARTRPAMDALVRMIAAHEVSRQYVAMAHRPWRGEAQREVNEAIGRDVRNRLRMTVVDLLKNPGKVARTHITLLATNEIGCLVRCRLHTGRTHQIRVHMAHIGHPLVADATYGGAAAAGMVRQALHAQKLAFVHPMTGQAMAFEASIPPDFAAAIETWGLGYNETTDELE